jgi:hypothetical protein
MTLIMVSSVGWNLYHEIKRAKKEGRKPEWSLFGFMVVFVSLAILPLYGATFPGIPAKMVAVLGLHLTQALAIAFVIALGFAASEFKLRGKLYYGMVEVFFGVISSVAIVSRVNFTPIPVSQMSLAQVTALVGSVYVVARGFTNIHEAKHPNPESKPQVAK